MPPRAQARSRGAPNLARPPPSATRWFLSGRQLSTAIGATIVIFIGLSVDAVGHVAHAMYAGDGARRPLAGAGEDDDEDEGGAPRRAAARRVCDAVRPVVAPVTLSALLAFACVFVMRFSRTPFVRSIAFLALSMFGLNILYVVFFLPTLGMLLPCASAARGARRGQRAGSASSQDLGRLVSGQDDDDLGGHATEAVEMQLAGRSGPDLGVLPGVGTALFEAAELHSRRTTHGVA